MNTPLEPATPAVPAGTRTSRRPGKKTYLAFGLAWMLLVGAGIVGAMLYAEHMRARTAADLAAQTQAQIDELKTRYDARFEELNASIRRDMDNLQAKVDTLNQLLAFVKDSANSKTDNSNQLYTQLAEVKKQLDELKRNLEVLK